MLTEIETGIVIGITTWIVTGPLPKGLTVGLTETGSIDEGHREREREGKIKGANYFNGDFKFNSSFQLSSKSSCMHTFLHFV